MSLRSPLSGDPTPPPPPGRPAPSVWMSVDPSLAHCGMVLVSHGYLVDATTFAIPSLVTSYPKMLAVFPSVLQHVEEMVERWAPEVVLYEAPPSSARLTNTESALLGAATIEAAAQERSLPVGRIDCRRARTTVIGYPTVGKSQVRKFFAERCPEWKLHDEHQRDAALIYLAAAGGASIDWSDPVRWESPYPPLVPPPNPPLRTIGPLEEKIRARKASLSADQQEGEALMESAGHR